MGRGMLTKDIQEKAKKFLNREITVSELRLYPYIQYQMMNEQMINFKCCNEEDYNILNKLCIEGHIKLNINKISITREFYDYINDVLFDSYVVRE